MRTLVLVFSFVLFSFSLTATDLDRASAEQEVAKWFETKHFDTNVSIVGAGASHYQYPIPAPEIYYRNAIPFLKVSVSDRIAKAIWQQLDRKTGGRYPEIAKDVKALDSALRRRNLKDPDAIHTASREEFQLASPITPENAANALAYGRNWFCSPTANNARLALENEGKGLSVAERLDVIKKGDIAEWSIGFNFVDPVNKLAWGDEITHNAFFNLTIPEKSPLTQEEGLVALGNKQTRALSVYVRSSSRGDLILERTGSLENRVLRAPAVGPTTRNFTVLPYWICPRNFFTTEREQMYVVTARAAAEFHLAARYFQNDKATFNHLTETGNILTQNLKLISRSKEEDLPHLFADIGNLIGGLNNVSHYLGISTAEMMYDAVFPPTK